MADQDSTLLLTAAGAPEPGFYPVKPMFTPGARLQYGFQNWAPHATRIASEYDAEVAGNIL